MTVARDALKGFAFGMLVGIYVLSIVAVHLLTQILAEVKK